MLYRPRASLAHLAEYPDYPFEPRYLDLDGVRLHYVSEGPLGGDSVIMLHGNPTWSYYYRKLVLALRNKYRVVAPDHIGMGMSDKPDDNGYEYSLARRVDDLERLLEHLEIDRDITLVMHDWGGGIGMAYAVRYPERIARLVVSNTAAFHLPTHMRFPWQLSVCRNPVLGPLLVRGLNAFCRYAALGCVRRRAMPAAVRGAYVAPYDSWRNRRAVLRFIQDIPLRPGDRAYDVVSEIESNLHRFADKPVLIFWGLKDFVFHSQYLDEWLRYLPRAEVHRFPDAGHYVLEDAADEIVPLMRGFLDSNPIAGCTDRGGESYI